METTELDVISTDWRYPVFVLYDKLQYLNFTLWGVARTNS